MDTRHYFLELLDKYVEGTLLPEEEREFALMLQNRSYHEWLSVEILDKLEMDPVGLKKIPEERTAEILSAILKSEPTTGLLPLTADTESAVNHRSPFPLRSTWLRYAAMILLLAGAATVLYLRHQSPKKEMALAPSKVQVDILPGGNKATLTLSDGSTIVLDSAANGSLASQGGLKIIKRDAGMLAYEGRNTGGEQLYNKVSTPKGGQYQLILPDGTKVWLNAASSVRFPTAFTGHRTIEISGESYLEVAPDHNRPFFVKTRGTTIQVLGTSFNVNAYADEVADKISLLEGSVKIGSTVLKPGQAYRSGKVMAADLEQDLAWKNGVFNFDNKPFEEAMRQLARWYDIQVVYERPVREIQFGGTFKRNLPLSEVLHFLEGVGLRYRLEANNRLVILNN